MADQVVEKVNGTGQCVVGGELLVLGGASVQRRLVVGARVTRYLRQAPYKLG